jgi:methionine biosynthesis protein MetW
MNYKYDNYREDILPFIPKIAKTILDVGCGTGKLLRVLKDQNKVCYGIEKDEDAFRIARQNAYTVINKRIEDAFDLIPDNYFDVILLLDVLEHLVDPRMVLQKLKSKLSPDGILVSSIPNLRYYHNFIDLIVKKEFNYTEYGVMDASHLKFFTYKSIVKLFEDADYTVIQQEGINPTPSKKFRILNFIGLGYFWDCKFMQFVTISKINNGIVE